MSAPARKRRGEVYTLDWIFDRAMPEPNSGCWIWMLGTNRGGYGATTMGGRRGNAHRLVWIAIRGDAPDGLDLDHLCRNRLCVNPDHMEPVTRSENLVRGSGPTMNRERTAGITHCPRGHPLSGDNLYLPARGRRECKECRRANVRRWYRRRASARTQPSF